MTKHIIQNYDQVKLRLEQLSKEHNKRSCDYYFAVGDLFNQEIPKGAGDARRQQRLGAEIERLLLETETDMSRGRLKHVRTTARAWPQGERVYDVSFGVYEALAAHKELMCEGLSKTRAEAAVQKKAGRKPEDGVADAILVRKLANDRVCMLAYNRTQRLVITVNQLRGQLKALDDDDGTPLTPEEVERIGEAYALLDAYCERKGVNMYDDAELVAA